MGLGLFERAVGIPIPTLEKARVIRLTLMRRQITNFTSPWAHFSGISPFTVTAGGIFQPGGATVVQLYGWNDDNPPADPTTGAPLSDPITAPGAFTYCAMLDWIAASVTGPPIVLPGVTIGIYGVEMNLGF